MRQRTAPGYILCLPGRRRAFDNQERGTSMELKTKAEISNLDQVKEFVTGALEECGFGTKQIFQVELAVEEIFTNIANYAYNPECGDAWIRCQVERGERDRFVITFIDEGIPYNPLEKADPDLTLDAEEREIGGLGIFLTKKLMDTMEYKYESGRNVLIITKQKEEET